MPSWMKTLKLWQAVVLVVVMLGAGGGVYGVYNWAAGPDTGTLPDNVQLVQVQYGNLVNSVSSGGNLVFPIKEQLIFGSAGTVQEVNVQEGDIVEEGQVLARIDSASTTTLERGVAQARVNLKDAEEDLSLTSLQTVLQAQNSLESAEENLARALNPYTESDIAQAELAVMNAELALQTAHENLQKAQDPYTEADVARAELAVISTEVALVKAQDAFDSAKTKYESNPSVPEWTRDYEQKLNQLTIAMSDLAEAEQALSEVLAGADPFQVAQKQKQLVVAEANLTNAEQTLADMQAGADPLEVELRQLELAGARAALRDALASLDTNAEPQGTVGSLEVELVRLQVSSAQAALDKAMENLEMATMVAPFGGTVTSVNAEAGQEVTAKQVVIELVDPSVVNVSAILDEIDVAQVKRGQRVSVYLDALPEIELSGEVSSISTVAKTQSGVVTYPITIKVDVPAGVQLMEGMSAVATIVVQQVNNALLVPNQAISGSFDNPVVNVMVNEEIRQRAITLGLSDGLWTEVITGLEATDMVVVQVAAAGTTQQSLGGMMAPGMGGFQMEGFQRMR